MKFKKLNNLVEYEVNKKTSYIKHGHVWNKNEDGIIFQVTDNKEIEKLNKIETEYKNANGIN